MFKEHAYPLKQVRVNALDVVPSVLHFPLNKYEDKIQDWATGILLEREIVFSFFCWAILFFTNFIGKQDIKMFS